MGHSTGVLTFNLGSEYDLTDALVWNVNFGPGAVTGVKTMTISISSDGASYKQVGGTYNLTEGTGFNGLAPNDLTLSNATMAQFVQFNITSNWGGGIVGLNEVEFLGTASATTPEPATLGLWLLAPALAFARRRPVA